MRNIENILCISRKELIHVINRKTLESEIQRKNIIAVERGWYSWDSVVAHGWAEKIKAKLWNGEEPNVNTLSSVLEGETDPYTIMVKTIDFYNGDPDCDGIEEIAKVFKKMDVAYWPHSARRIYDRVKAIMNAKGNTAAKVREVYKPKREGNKNACKYNLPDVMDIIMTGISHPGNFSNSHLARVLAHNLNMIGYDVPVDWLRKQIANAESYTPLLNKHKLNIHKKEIALFAGDVWEIDGTRVNFISHNVEGKEKFLYVIAVRDAYSGMVLGLHFDYTEDRFAWISAVQDAINTAKHLPAKIVTDHFPGHNTEDAEAFIALLRKFGTKVHFTSAATGKAKLERWFGTMQTVFLQRSEWYYGQGVKAHVANAHREESYLKAQKRKRKDLGWDFQGAVKEAYTLIQAFNHTSYHLYSRKYAKIQYSPAELYENSDKPSVIILQDSDLVQLYWQKKTIKLRGIQCFITVDYEERVYALNSYELATRHNGQQVTVFYLPEERDIFLFSAKTAEFIGRFQQNVDLGNAEIGRINKMLKKSAQATLDRAKETTERLGIDFFPDKTAGSKYDQTDELALLMPHEPKQLKEAAESKMLNSIYDNEDIWNR